MTKQEYAAYLKTDHWKRTLADLTMKADRSYVDVSGTITASVRVRARNGQPVVFADLRDQGDVIGMIVIDKKVVLLGPVANWFCGSRRRTGRPSRWKDAVSRP